MDFLDLKLLQPLEIMATAFGVLGVGLLLRGSGWFLPISRSNEQFSDVERVDHPPYDEQVVALKGIVQNVADFRDKGFLVTSKDGHVTTWSQSEDGETRMLNKMDARLASTFISTIFRLTDVSGKDYEAISEGAFNKMDLAKLGFHVDVQSILLRFDVRDDGSEAMSGHLVYKHARRTGANRGVVTA